MAKCPYCARPLRMWGLQCRACRRFVLQRAHIAILILVAVVAVVVLLEILGYLAPPPLKSF